ncbi:hypothetical protein JFU58_03055 [Pseudomonas sp. TH34]|jgi:hypothetical protein|uniref:hypothetical protein n=1 Tax=Pseudomonas TaxID=286 RepID=UPI00036A6F9E|nr:MULTISPECIES: hypothetical protein [unclassified Pseudomonas]MBK5407517.1 hypothetical protein [Pseudomonas sp. TH34]
MNYFDNNLVETLNKNGILYERLSDKEQEDFINNIQNKIIFAGSKIDWEALENATELSYMDRPLALTIVAEKLGSLGIQQVIFLSDSAIEHAYSININDIKKALEIFADFPQHTYIFPQSLHWIACLAFEGQIDYADLTHD